MRERRRYWGATAGAGLTGVGACVALAALDLVAVGALGATALLCWLTGRIVAGVPAATASPRPAPCVWSPYDRRRTGRVPFARRFARHCRPRRRPPPSPPTAAGDDLLLALLWSGRHDPHARPLPSRWRQRDAR